MANKNREANDLTDAELVDFVAGLREYVYGDVDDAGKDVWNPDASVAGADLISWVCEEFERLGLVPEAGPRS